MDKEKLKKELYFWLVLASKFIFTVIVFGVVFQGWLIPEFWDLEQLEDKSMPKGDTTRLLIVTICGFVACGYFVDWVFESGNIGK